MAVTPNFAFPTPNDSDLVSEGAEAIRALGDAVDATVFAQGTAITAVEGRVTTAETDITAVEGRVTTAETDITELETVGFRFVGTRYYTSSGTFAKANPFGNGSFDGAKMRAIRVRLVGAGGGAGGCATTGAGQGAAGRAGGGGGYSESFITNIAGLASSVSVTRGAGGAGGAAGNTVGSTGGNSSFGSLVIGNGGGLQGDGGIAQTAPFAQSTPGENIGGAGDLVIQGGTPLDYVAFASGFGSGQAGAGSFLASYRRGTSVFNSGANGANGLPHGGGASGGHNHQNQGTARSGGAGANGIVIVDVFA